MILPPILPFSNAPLKRLSTLTLVGISGVGYTVVVIGLIGAYIPQHTFSSIMLCVGLALPFYALLFSIIYFINIQIPK